MDIFHTCSNVDKNIGTEWSTGMRGLNVTIFTTDNSMREIATASNTPLAQYEIFILFFYFVGKVSKGVDWHWSYPNSSVKQTGFKCPETDFLQRDLGSKAYISMSHDMGTTNYRRDSYFCWWLWLLLYVSYVINISMNI